MTTLDVPSSPRAAPGTGYRPIRGLTAAIVALLSVHVLLRGAAAAFDINGLHLGETLPDGLKSFDRAVVLLHHATSISRAADAVWLLTGVVFLVWVHRTYRNLPALGSESLRLTPGAAVAGWFIPFRNLAHGYLSIRDLYLESQPPAAQLPGAPTLARGAPLVAWWWCLFLGSAAVDLWIEFDLHVLHGEMKTWVFEAYDICPLVTIAVAAVVCALMVLRIARRQADQHDDLVRRIPVPPPADRLR